MSSLVSVVIPSYNRSALAAQAIESVLGQSYGDFEIVFVDDGSIDDTRQVVAAYDNSRIRYIYQENAGLGAARNMGIARAQGQYVAFLDSDDLFLPRCLEHQVHTFERETSAGFVAGGYVLIDETGQRLAARRPWQHLPRVDLLAALRALPLIPSGMVVRKEWLEKMGGFSNMRRSEDYDLWIRLIYGGCSMAWTPHLVCGYRIHSGQMVNDGRSQKESALVALDRFFAQPGLPEPLNQQRDKVYALAYLSGAFREYGAGQVDDARASLAQAIALNPALMAGPAPQVADALLGWAVDPITGDPVDYIQHVLAHLPPAAASMNAKEQRLVYAAAIRSAVDAIEVDNIALARDYLKPLGQARYRPGNNPDLFITLAAEAVRGCEMDTQEVVLDQIFACLPDGAAAAWRRKTLGRVYMAHSFTCLGRGARREARRWAWQGVRQDPAWLKNRGVLSILGKPSILRTA
ncbi:MAG: glycosyltransferase [Anaerolineae bacterium]